MIGLPGDHVTIKAHHVAVNDKSLTGAETVNGDRVTATETLGSRSWHVQWSSSAATSDIDLVVPPGQIFLLGDSRDLSSDSRQFGTVPLSDLVGKARQIWFSKGENGIRWGRLGKVLE